MDELLIRFNRNKAVCGEGELGPFRDCIRMTTALFEKVIIPELTAAATDEFPQWRYPKQILTGETGLESNRDDRDLFQLLKSVEQSVKTACTQVHMSIDRQTNSMKSPENDVLLAHFQRMKLKAAATRDKIIEAIQNFKEELLGHPINIVLAAFLMDLSNQNTVTKVGIYDYAYRYGVARTARSFFNTFPYDYLAAVYMIGFDSYVRMVAQQPTIENFKREAASMEVFTDRAYSDIENVSIFCCYLFIYL